MLSAPWWGGWQREEIGRGWWFNRGLKSIVSGYKRVDSLSLGEEQAPGGLEVDVPKQEISGSRKEGAGAMQLEAQQGASIYKRSVLAGRSPGWGDVSSSPSDRVSFVWMISIRSLVRSVSLSEASLSAQHWAWHIKFGETWALPWVDYDRRLIDIERPRTSTRWLGLSDIWDCIN